MGGPGAWTRVRGRQRSMPGGTDILRLRNHVPAASWPVVVDWLRRHDVEVRISRPRTSKLGDYRVEGRGLSYRISVNNDLNRYAFLVVLVHEFAHHATFLKDRRHQPHGPEWKAEYKRLMTPFLSPQVFPEDVLSVLEEHLLDAPGSSCSDPRLMRVLRKYDSTPRPFLEELPHNTVFRFNQRLFVKGDRLRTRYRCRCLNDRRIYHIDRTAEVHVEQPAGARRAS